MGEVVENAVVEAGAEDEADSLVVTEGEESPSVDAEDDEGSTVMAEVLNVDADDTDAPDVGAVDDKGSFVGTEEGVELAVEDEEGPDVGTEGEKGKDEEATVPESTVVGTSVLPVRAFVDACVVVSVLVVISVDSLGAGVSEKVIIE